MSTTTNTNDNGFNPVRRLATQPGQNIRCSRHVDGTNRDAYYQFPGSRWQKHGHDRIYFDNHDGYVDLKTGELNGNTPITNIEIIQYDNSTWTIYYASTKQDVANETPEEHAVIALERDV
ncbi:hypothetical protein [Halobacterium salinarum]|uniref:hypothetical protein n=1 Tax=Halobacterium salinarum TaxID=2242 RepID=UPI001F32F194|nr:hypothetical protein [Halobacterium salinarum]MCF2165426.1 hypothetical protein [Halobacterium salinarum]MCF2168291.1 hypothetical protein [Halobacterium salinarum]